MSPHSRSGRLLVGGALGLVLSLAAGCGGVSSSPTDVAADATTTAASSATTGRPTTTVKRTAATAKIATAPTSAPAEAARTGGNPAAGSDSTEDAVADFSTSSTTTEPAPVTPAGGNGGTESTTTSTTAVGTVVLEARASTLGTILTDGEGHTLYASAADKANIGSCIDACAAQWVPIKGDIVKSAATVNAALVGQLVRVDAIVQLTYNGIPLYRLQNEPIGEILGQGDAGTWYVVDVSGLLVGAP